MKHKIHKAGELLDPNQTTGVLVNLTQNVIKPNAIPRKSLAYATEIPFSQIPDASGRVVMVFQRKKDGIGHINVRWGRATEHGSILATFVFADEDGQSAFGRLNPAAMD